LRFQHSNPVSNFNDRISCIRLTRSRTCFHNNLPAVSSISAIHFTNGIANLSGIVFDPDFVIHSHAGSGLIWSRHLSVSACRASTRRFNNLTCSLHSEELARFDFLHSSFAAFSSALVGFEFFSMQLASPIIVFIMTMISRDFFIVAPVLRYWRLSVGFIGLPRSYLPQVVQSSNQSKSCLT
jgi:hypothetical protein